MISIDISNIETQTLIDFIELNIKDFSNFQISILFKPDYSQSKIVRNFIAYIFDKNNIDNIWKNRFSLIGDELINNSIEYGSMPLDKNELRIAINRDIKGNMHINFEVEDTGKGMYAKNSTQMEELRMQKKSEGFVNYLGKRGRGLFQLITNMVDNLYFKDSVKGGLIVGVEKTIV